LQNRVASFQSLGQNSSQSFSVHVDYTVFYTYTMLIEVLAK